MLKPSTRRVPSEANKGRKDRKSNAKVKRVKRARNVRERGAKRNRVKRQQEHRRLTSPRRQLVPTLTKATMAEITRTTRGRGAGCNQGLYAKPGQTRGRQPRRRRSKERPTQQTATYPEIGGECFLKPDNESKMRSRHKVSQHKMTEGQATLENEASNDAERGLDYAQERQHGGGKRENKPLALHAAAWNTARVRQYCQRCARRRGVGCDQG